MQKQVLTYPYQMAATKESPEPRLIPVLVGMPLGEARREKMVC
jgi:hypothetical protein